MNCNVQNVAGMLRLVVAVAYSQVSWLMAEASAVNNLARMYEGWTSWI